MFSYWLLWSFTVSLLTYSAAVPALGQDLPSITTSFGAPSIVVGQSTSLTFKIVPGDGPTGAELDVSLPSGLVVASPNGFSGFSDGTCSGGILTAEPGAQRIRLSALTIKKADPACVFSVNVIATTVGIQNNLSILVPDQGPDIRSDASLTVTQATTTIHLDTSQHLQGFGRQFTLVATVTVDRPGGGIPTGPVALHSGTTWLADAQLSRDARATFSISLLAVGSHKLTATYGGDSNFVGSKSAELTQIVDRAKPSVTISAIPSPASLGRPVDYHVIVRGDGGIPTGTVKVYDGPTLLGEKALSTDGTAKLSRALSWGTHTVIARYEGDTNFTEASSGPLLQAIEWGVDLNDLWQQGIAAMAAFAILMLIFWLFRRVRLAGIGRGLKTILYPIVLIWRLTKAIGRGARRVNRFAFRRAPTQPTAELAVKSVLAPTVGAIGRAITGGTQTDEAIFADGFDPASIRLQRNGTRLCRWLQPGPPEAVPYTRQVAEEDFPKAVAFFQTNIPIDSKAQLLFEDIETAFIVSLFSQSDKPCFYVLSEFRKAITGNVGKLAILFSTVLFLILAINMLFLLLIGLHLPVFDRYLPAARDTNYPLVGSWYVVGSDVNKITLALLSTLAGIVIMWIFYGRRLEPYQTHNGQYLANYLQQYMNNIRDHYREARGIAVGVAQGARGSEEQVKTETVLWITNMQWLGFRLFFIEVYLRNILFQIHRNTSYWILLTPPILGAILLVIGYLLYRVNLFIPISALGEQSFLFAACAILFFWMLSAAYWIYLRKSVSFVFNSVNQLGWPKFSTIRIQDGMTHILETYVAELVMLKTMHAPQAFHAPPPGPHQPPPPNAPHPPRKI